MNRLILIGNGFDLAHGLKTSYKDFIFDYLKSSLIEILDSPNRDYEDGFIKITRNHKNAIIKTNVKEKPVEGWILDDLLCLIETNKKYKKRYINRNPPPPFYDYFFLLEIKSELINNLLSHCNDANWVDIENEYYNLLCEYIEYEDGVEKVKELNVEFQKLQDLLQKYLLKIDKDIASDQTMFLNQDSCEQLTEPIYNTQIKEKPNSILFLNFNYTQTIEHYLRNIAKIVPKTDVIYIHGQLDSKSNPIIFGYGDEDETNFNLLEKYDDECLKYVKTYWYLRTDNYSKFLSFIESDEFEVYIMGHSCGMSDKTMLSSIFNNQNCKKIKILTYNKDTHNNPSLDNTNYIEMTYQIGRLFNKKSDLRKKLINFNPNDLLQIRKKLLYK
ncbi:hypothetical protein VO54_02202 [Elizabethkingia miricola]|nr:hypothetical protein VO54_02202 [Elizabethkingia miricola]